MATPNTHEVDPAREDIVFVAPFLNASIRKDFELLSTGYRVYLNRYNWKRKPLVPFYLLHQLVTLPVRVASSRCVVIEFGGYWALVPSLLARLLHKPVYIVLRGTDSAALENPPYGSLRRFPLKSICHWSYRMATVLLPVSESLIYAEQPYAGAPQGVTHHFPSLKTPACPIANGFDAVFWGMDGAEPRPVRRPNRVIAAFDDSQHHLKGGDLIVEVARMMPHCEFVIAGSDGRAAANPPSDLRFLGRCNRDELRQEFHASSVHLQLSYFEGFGNALAEAMLCGCIPIVSDVNALPEIAGTNGYVLKKPDAAVLKELLTKAIAEATEERRAHCAEHIRTKYSLERRREALLEVVAQGVHSATKGGTSSGAVR